MRRLSRRRFLASSGATLAAASAAAVLGCRDKKSTPAPNAGSAQPGLAAVTTRGGVLRTYNFDAMIQDSLDPHLTQMGPIADLHAGVFSRLYRYADDSGGTIVPDLAAAMPEQPDNLTYIIKLRDGVTFHDTPQIRVAYPALAGRALTVDDVKYSIERQSSRNSPQARRFYRQGNWSVIDRIDVSDTGTLAIRLKQPVAPFLGFLAGRHAFIIAKETVDAGDQANSVGAMVGTGPFLLDSLEAQAVMRLRRNPSWFARDDNPGAVGAGRPFLDGYDAFFAPQEDAFQRIAFERRAIDSTGFSDPAVLDSERKTNLADIALEETDAGGILASRLLLDRAPFKDDRVRRAVHLAIDRNAIIDLLYPAVDGGRASARLTGPVAPAMRQWAIGDADLSKHPGYRGDDAGRADDVRKAKQLWEAALGDAPIGDVHVLFAGIPKTFVDKAMPALQQQLQSALGLNIVPVVDPSGYALIAASLGRNIEGAAEGVTLCTFAMEDGGNDLDDWLYPHFRSGQPMNTYRLQDAQLDAMLDKQRAEFDADARRKIGLDIQDYLITNVNARLEYLAPVQRRLTWGYVRNSSLPAWYGATERLADTWLDTTHPSWRPRSA
jgi:peptide/nickel transport system substrate-binding protein